MATEHRKPQQDDTDEFMAALLGKHSKGEHTRQPAKTAPELPASPRVPDSDKTISKTVPRTSKAAWPRRKLALVLPLLLVTLSLVGLIFMQREGFFGFLAPPSPFTAETKASLAFPVYYPTKMPGTFKFELGSITQPQGDVIVYRLTNDEQAAITVSQQAPTDKIDINTLYEDASGVEKFEGALGATWIGTMPDGTLIANIVGTKTWIIVTTGSGVVSADEMKQMLASLRQG